MRAAIGFVLTTLCAAGAVAYDTDDTRATLKGIKTVAVIVDISMDSHVAQQVEELDLSGLRSTAQADAELKLRQAGIGIVSAEQPTSCCKRQRPAPSDQPFLIISVSFDADDGGVATYTVEAALFQAVNLDRIRGLSLDIPTWSVSRYGTVGAMKTGEPRASIKDLVNRFVVAYLSANPKQ